jgi:hypothetical protein
MARSKKHNNNKKNKSFVLVHKNIPEPHPTTFTMISYAIIDCRLKGIYKAINKQQYDRASDIINDTIRSIKAAVENECDPKFVEYVICQLYMMLLDIAFNRKQDVHSKVRDLHYQIYNITSIYNNETYNYNTDLEYSDDSELIHFF